MKINSKVTILDKDFDVFIENIKIQKRIESIANQINLDYKNKKVTFVCVLDGCFMFASDLIQKIDLECEVIFIKIKSYKNMESLEINELIGLSEKLDNKNVILVEDIVDTGKTINYIKNNINYKSLRIATLLSKSDIHDIKLNYVGFEIQNKFVIGYGLDYNGLGRNLRDIYQIT